jgi:hypothetical protein
MFNHRHYVPILKWKMGEYQALQRLSEPVKDSLTPLFEIPPVGFDFESGTDKKTPDEHLADFGKRLKSKWQGRRCFVDLKYLPPNTRMEGGLHYVEATMASARAEGCSAVPVVSFANDAALLSSVAGVVRQDRRGVCFRLVLADFNRRNLAADIETLLRPLVEGWSEVDLVIDTGTTVLPTTIMLQLMGLVPVMNRWRTVTIAATSYPETIAQIRAPFEIVPRLEWTAYKEYLAQLGRETRIPTFGDYAVAHPDLVELDMRIIKPFAKLRYTIDDSWYIARGSSVRTDGFGQYQQMCARLIAQPFFSGRNYSAADAYIEDCANGVAKTGNLSTWVWVSTNRHLTKVVDDLSNLSALSVAA